MDIWIKWFFHCTSEDSVMRVGLKNSLEQKKNAPANIKDQLSNKKQLC